MMHQGYVSAVGSMHAVRRDGDLYILDGRHRLAVLQELIREKVPGFSESMEIPIHILEDGNEAQMLDAGRSK